MPPQRPPEKTHYSYKEMMERLKRDRRNGGGGEASSRSESGPVEGERPSKSQPVRVEVVERPDGSQQVAEVRRRRRRRSHQPKKVKEERIRKIKRALMIGGIPLIALVIGSYFLMLSRIKTEGFRLAASEQISGLAGADLEFGRFSMRGLVLSSRKIVLDEVPGTLIRGGEASAPKATLSAGSLLTGDWKLGMVQTSNSQLRFGPARDSTADTSIQSGDGLAFSTRALAAGLGLDRRPNAVYAEGIHLGLSDFVWESRGSGGAKFVDGASFSVGRPGTDPLDLILTGGDLNVPGWPEFEIGRISGEVSDGVVEIETSTLEQGENGVAKLTGKIGIVGSGRYDLGATYEGIEARDLVHPFWKDSFAGQVSGHVNLSGSLLDPSTLTATGDFSARKLVVSNNRMFRALAHELGEALLGRVEFRSFGGRYRRDAEKTEFYDLVGEHPSLFRFRGQASAFVDGRLHGEFEIGIPETILDKIEGGKPGEFGVPDDDGFCWTSVEVTGLIDDPREDLTEKLEVRRRAVEEQKRFDPEGGTKPEEAGEAFENLIKP